MGLKCDLDNGFHRHNYTLSCQVLI